MDELREQGTNQQSTRAEWTNAESEASSGALGTDPGDLLHEALQELVGLHKQLLEVIRQEAQAITQADVKATFEATSAKEALVHWIHRAELGRQVITQTLSEHLKIKNVSLKEIILHFQSHDAPLSARLQSDLNMLVTLVERIQSQNKENGKIVERSLKHVQSMRKNIFGEVPSENKTYNQQGQKNQASVGSTTARLISKEV